MTDREQKFAGSVFVVDDNAGMLASVSGFLRAAGHSVETFGSAQAFLGALDIHRSGCLILDLQMPEMDGHELQEKLIRMGAILPVIVVSGHADVADAVRSMKLGSFDFLEKPYAPEVLLKRVEEALALNLERRKQAIFAGERKVRLATLSSREKQVLLLVIAGMQSKTIAEKLSLSVSTIDNHRANIMKKLHANTSAELTRIVLVADPDLAFLKG